MTGIGGVRPRMQTGVASRAVGATAALVVTVALAVLPGVRAPAARPLAAQPSSGRILFAGTDHLSLGSVPGTGGQAASGELFGAGPAHFDQQDAARGGLLVFTSLRDEPRPQVYLRDTTGAVRRLTTGMDAAHPQLSPGGAFVVFDSPAPGGGAERDLWRVGVDGTGLRRLTDTPFNETCPTVSPDGTRIAYSSDQDAGLGAQIYIRPLAGGAAVRVTGIAGGASEPAWNPVDDPAHADLIAYTAGGDQLRETDGHGTDTQLLGGDQASWQTHSASWLPDGNDVLFLSPNQPCGCPTAFDRVYRATAGSAATAQELLAEDRGDQTPTWLGPLSGGTVVVTRDTAPAPNVATLQDMLPDGTDPRDLGITVLREDPRDDPTGDPLFNPRPGFDPWLERQNYSPDGRHLVVTRFEDSTAGRIERIWLANADGSDPRPLPLAGRGPTDWDTDPTFSPDGRRIAFTRMSPGGVGSAAGPSRVLVADVATGAIVATVPQPVADAGMSDAQPDFSPDGRTLAFTRTAVINGIAGNKHVWTVPLDALDQQHDLSAAVCPGTCEVIDDSPAFSPDGAAVAFNRKDGAGLVNERDGILLARLAGGGCQVLLPTGLRGNPRACEQELPDTSTTGPFQPRDAAFSADGGHLVFTSRRTVAGDSPEGLADYDMASGTFTPIDWSLPGRQKEPSIQQTVNVGISAPATVGTVDVGAGTQVTATVTNHGSSPSPGTSLTVAVPAGLQLAGLTASTGRCDVRALRCDLGTMPAGAATRVTADLVALTAGDQRLTWSVSTEVLDADPSDNSATTVVPVAVAPPPPPPPLAAPGLSATAQPDPGFVGGRVTVTYTVHNASNALATGLRLELGLPAGVPAEPLPAGCTAGACTVADLPPGASAVVQAVLAPVAPLQTTLVATLLTTGTDANPNDNVARIPLTILQPRIVAVPTVGKPGFVTLVRGQDFPPGAPVRLTWSPGITAAAAPTIPGGDFRFTAQLLILAKDQTGPRTITASGPGFSPVTTPFLVVDGTIGPPDEVERR